VQAADNGVPPTAFSNNGGDVLYGWSDLSYYGNWSYMPGFGYGWMPNVYAGWSPYSFGRWCWYPGFGYTWISFDPWGWLPYHYGGWMFIPGIGWVWFPGFFGAWSPALVTWYGGPGWIGWMPLPPFPNRSRNNPCPQSQSCGVAVSTNAFRSGRPVGPGTILSVNPESGKRMEQPDILPDRQAMLPGSAVAPPAGFTNTKLIIIGTHSAPSRSQTINTQPATPALGTAPGLSHARSGSTVASVVRYAAPGPESGIVYDPAAGRYVNNSRLPSTAKPAPSELPNHALPSVSGASAALAAQPAPGTLGGPAPAPQSHGLGWFHRFSSRSDFSSAAAPRSGEAAAGGQARGGSSFSGGGSVRGAASGGGGGTGGGSHAGGGSGSGGHR
jgi:hypothetical protein